jgi:hypothetical protein
MRITARVYYNTPLNSISNARKGQEHVDSSRTLEVAFPRCQSLNFSARSAKKVLFGRLAKLPQ